MAIRTHARNLLSTGGTTAYNDFGHQPIACLFGGCGGGTLGTVGSNMRFGIGMATAAAQRNQYLTSDDALDTSDTAMNGGTTLSHQLLTPGGSTLVQLDIDSFDADGLTATWTGSGIYTGVLSLGGAGVTNAIILTKAMPGVTGNFSLTGAGFQGNFAVLMMRSQVGLTSRRCVAFGFCNDRGQQACGAIMDQDNVGTANNSRLQRTDRCLTTIDTSSLRDSISIVSFDSDGMTFNCQDANTTDNFEVLILKVPRSYIGAFTTRSTTGTQQITGMDLTPSGGCLFSFGNAATTLVLANANMGLAFWSGPIGPLAVNNLGGFWGGSEDAVGVTDCYEMPTATFNICNHQDGSIHHAAYPSAFLADGLELQYDIADAAYEGIVVAVGNRATVEALGGEVLGGTLGGS